MAVPTCIVPSGAAGVAVSLGARHASLDGDAVSDLEALDAWAESDDFARRLVPGAALVRNDHRWTDVPVLPEMHVRAAVS